MSAEPTHKQQYYVGADGLDVTPTPSNGLYPPGQPIRAQTKRRQRTSQPRGPARLGFRQQQGGPATARAAHFKCFLLPILGSPSSFGRCELGFLVVGFSPSLWGFFGALCVCLYLSSSAERRVGVFEQQPWRMKGRRMPGARRSSAR